MLHFVTLFIYVGLDIFNNINIRNITDLEKRHICVILQKKKRFTRIKLS